MSFIRLAPEDFVVSSDSVSAPVWSSGNPTAGPFFTSAAQTGGSSGLFYVNAYAQNPSLVPTAEIQFAVAYGNKTGAGSSPYNSAVAGATPTRTVYGQFRNLVLGDENADFVFGGITSNDFYAITFDRNRYKQALLPGSLSLAVNGYVLTDNSLISPSVIFNDAGRVYNLIDSSGLDTYGWFLPDIGTILLNPSAIGLSSPASSGNPAVLLGLITSFTLNYEETISSDYVFVRARNAEFNYSENPSFISGSTGEVIYNSFVNNPQTFPTTIGLYNDNNELLAVAKLSRPLLKDFTKEALVRVKLDF